MFNFDVLSGIMEKLGGGPEKGLDKTRAKLDELSRDVEAMKDPNSLVERVKTAFEDDLDEWKISRETPDGVAKRREYWETVKAEILRYLDEMKKEAALRSPEYQNLDAFTGRLENLPGFQELINSQTLLGRIEQFCVRLRTEHPKAAAVLVAWLSKEAKKNADENEGVPGLEGKAFGWLAAKLEPPKPKTPGQPVATGAPGAPGAAAEKAPEADPLAAPQMAEFLTAANITDKTIAKQDYATLLQAYNNDSVRLLANAKAAASPTSKTRTIYGAIERKLPKNQAFPHRVSDIRFEDVMDDRVINEQIIKAIASTDQAIVTADKMRGFLDTIKTGETASIKPAAKSHLNVDLA